MKIKSFCTAICLTITLAGCFTPASDTEGSNTEKKANCKYTCTMHPEVCSDKPGLCPKCGMDLTEKE